MKLKNIKMFEELSDINEDEEGLEISVDKLIGILQNVKFGGHKTIKLAGTLFCDEIKSKENPNAIVLTSWPGLSWPGQEETFKK
jgi:hypothetical protein